MPYLDCLAAAKHFLTPEVLSRYAIDPERVAVSGDSAGGNLAAAVVQEVYTETISCSNVFKNILWMQNKSFSRAVLILIVF